MTNKPFHDLAKKLKDRPENKFCADCLMDETEWASVNLGILVCIQCSGIHRNLGVHISKVKSINLDEWDEQSYKNLESQGNYKANSYWECNLFTFEKPLKEDPVSFRKKFIIEKYVKKKYVPLTKDSNLAEVERQFDITQFSKKGFLTKLGQENKNWKKRYFVLHEDTLLYYKQQSDSYPAGQFNIETDCKISFVDENQIQKKNCFSIVAKDRNWFIFAESETEMVEWVYSLRGAVYYANLKKVLNDPRNFLKGDNINAVEKKGFLKKTGGAIRTVHKRWFVLKDNVLHYYKTEKDAEPAGSIDLKGSSISLLPKKKNEFGLCIQTVERQFTVIADTEQEQQSWYNTLVSVVENMSDSQIIKKKSSAIHNLILNRMVYSTISDSADRSDMLSPHSPLQWKNPFFHRSKNPNNVEQAPGATNNNNSATSPVVTTNTSASSPAMIPRTGTVINTQSANLDRNTSAPVLKHRSPTISPVASRANLRSLNENDGMFGKSLGASAASLVKALEEEEEEDKISGAYATDSRIAIGTTDKDENVAGDTALVSSEVELSEEEEESSVSISFFSRPTDDGNNEDKGLEYRIPVTKSFAVDEEGEILGATFEDVSLEDGKKKKNALFRTKKKERDSISLSSDDLRKSLRGPLKPLKLEGDDSNTDGTEKKTSTEETEEAKKAAAAATIRATATLIPNLKRAPGATPTSKNVKKSKKIMKKTAFRRMHLEMEELLTSIDAEME